MKVRIRTAAVAAALILPLSLGACSTGGDSATPNGTNTTAAAQDSNDPFNATAGAEVDKDAFMEQTQAAMLEKGSYAMTMTMSLGGQDMKVTGVGDMTDKDNLKAKMTMEMPGSTGQGINVLLVNKTMYMQLPGQAGGKYVEMPMEQLTQAGGGDFERLLNPAESLRMSKDAVNKITFVGEEDKDGQKLKHYQMELDLTKANEAAGVTPAPNATGPQTVPYDVWVDNDKLMRQMEMTVEGTKVTMLLDKYGEPVDIAAPPSASITTMPGMPQPTS
ncbi:hypothetical protein BJY21_000641 [Kineosphaera limosa]|uniref:Lipoprotein n=1 Tax=Kineosphaera limosa NBRC 100340 TaxID=1184609 RepID=K6XHC2_9MICO|nr:LppX_LprAFG lipoprotein [Kineosphaera limosa]NYD99456.1 hypothetical protein [Kineosphaera limosa]GAB98234.1 hypothetical protein KILIM_114_00090 [Kineosphaera limosa NBRC 100340]